MTPKPETNSTLSLDALQGQVERWITEIGGGYYSILTNALLLMEEVGELARLLARHYGDQSFKPGEDSSPQALADEFADILFVLACLANQTGVDLAQAFQEKLARKNVRLRPKPAGNSS
ncbi:MAG: nucleotide pyrophosphohydrolase [Bacteroidia bacterium]|nr:nucleotide pyrophosphohydrolase [Bacteroidia bacterium]MDW8088866.1 nucleotide pyrophosphohydrolase [Bacteroidia bacterium]